MTVITLEQYHSVIQCQFGNVKIELIRHERAPEGLTIHAIIYVYFRAPRANRKYKLKSSIPSSPFVKRVRYTLCQKNWLNNMYDLFFSLSLFDVQAIIARVTRSNRNKSEEMI